jgi:hypothetical protein
MSMPDESAAVDAEVARINRVAEKLGLRPLGINQVGAVQAHDVCIKGVYLADMFSGGVLRRVAASG